MWLRIQIGTFLGTLVLMMGIYATVYLPAQRESTALQFLQEEAVTKSAIVARLAASALESYAREPMGDDADLQSVSMVATELDDVTYLQLFNRDDKSLLAVFDSPEDVIGFSDRDKVQTKTDSHTLHVNMPVRRSDIAASSTNAAAAGARDRELLGSIQIGFSLDRMYSQFQSEQHISLAVVAAMVLCAVLIASLLSNILMQPIEALEKVFLAYGQGDESVRAKAKGPREIGRLGVAFNHMADALEQSVLAERRKATELSQTNKVLEEIESKFRGAFENAPIGMGLLDAAGRLFDVNPALRQLFWPKTDGDAQYLFLEAIEDNDLERFLTIFQKLVNADCDSFAENINCIDAGGETLRTVVYLSAVRSAQNKFRYAVLQVQDVTESSKLTVQLEYQASYDELTGLLNRRSFDTEFTRAWEQGASDKTHSYVLVLDLDQFKIVNDTSGHAAGDQLLRRVSDILVDNVRSNDAVCRLGGDEFGIILWECPTDVARRVGEAIRSSIENLRFQWDDETYRIGVCIGGLQIDQKTGDTNELMKLADAACYAAKEAGRNRVHLVEEEPGSVRLHRGQLRWVQRLREAMDNDRFAIYAQLIKPMAEELDEPERFEILLRLRDPETRKLIPPGAFLPAAQRYNLSTELDQWVVKSLIDKLFIHESFNAQHRRYWINLSLTSIGDERFAEFLVDAVERSPLPKGTINFEITETAAIRNIVDAGKLMLALRDMGCQFALDGFGSGLSSFSHLKILPVDILKIDGTFVREILTDKSNRIFVKSIIDIGHAMGIKVVAEHVENKEILEMIRCLGADYAQGFEISEPFELVPQFPQSAPPDGAPHEAQDQEGQ